MKQPGKALCSLFLSVVLQVDPSQNLAKYKKLQCLLIQLINQ